MVCETCREALSARLDGEDEPVPPAEVDAHLACCPACARWLADAEALTRHLRVRPAVATPDLADDVLAAAPPARVAPRARAALLVVAVLQMGVAMAQMLGSSAHAGHADAGHLFNEGVAWNLALALGLLMAAIRTDHARGLLTTLAGFVAVLFAYSAHDLVTATATVSRVLSHLPLLAGLLLLYVINRAHDRHSGPGHRAGSHDERAAHADPDHERAGTPSPRTGPRPLRPSARRAAA